MRESLKCLVGIVNIIYTAYFFIIFTFSFLTRAIESCRSEWFVCNDLEVKQYEKITIFIMCLVMLLVFTACSADKSNSANDVSVNNKTHPKPISCAMVYGILTMLKKEVRLEEKDDILTICVFG